MENLECALCGEKFECRHEMVEFAYGQKLKVPHCKKCFYDAGICVDKHGYQCGKCQKLYPEFQP